jgi:hypothetical protein
MGNNGTLAHDQIVPTHVRDSIARRSSMAAQAAALPSRSPS